MLIDGTAVLYRAHFAIRGLSTRSGRPTNAVFGFIRMLRQLRQVWKPTHWAVAFDGGLPEERLTLLEEYKAQRPPMPDDLCRQLEPAQTYLESAGVAWVRLEGQEADDVLASVAEWAGSEAGRVLIATGDKDMYQLVDERVQIVPVAGTVTQTIGPGEVRRKTGVAPGQVVEWLALVGDVSDNIPGVPGVGPKTAADLLGRYGTLDGLWAHLDEVPGKRRAALKAHRETVARNVEMIRLRRDLASSLDWEAMRVREGDRQKLLELFEALEFGSLAAEMREQDLFQT
jgi:DNA polymerase-1